MHCSVILVFHINNIQDSKVQTLIWFAIILRVLSMQIFPAQNQFFKNVPYLVSVLIDQGQKPKIKLIIKVDGLPITQSWLDLVYESSKHLHICVC